MSGEDDSGDSIRALERLARSQRVRAWLMALWPYIAPGLFVAGGWIARGVTIADKLDANTQAVTRLGEKVDQLATSVEGNRIEQERRAFAIGRQSAYATAGFQAYEPAKTKDQKRAYAEKYAAAYERLVNGGKAPQDALAMLFENVSLP